MSKSKKTKHRDYKSLEPFEDRVAFLFEELELAIKWERPSILLAVYGSELIRLEAEVALEQRLLELGQSVHRLQVNEKRFDIPLVLLQLPDRDKMVFFVSGLKWGGGRDGYNAYRALNIRREHLVEGRIRVVFWITENEANDLPRYAPDFWAFRHRVVEFTESSVPVSVVTLVEGLTRREWKPRTLREDTDTKIALREALLADLPDRDESQSVQADLLDALASLYWVKGEYKKSIDLLKQGLGIAQRLKVPGMQAQFWVGLGIVYNDLGRDKDSISAHKEAVKLNPQDAAPWNNLGNVYRDLSRSDDAINAYQKAIDLNPKDASPWNNLGNVYRDLGCTDDAISAYKKAIRLDPKDANPQNNLGSLYHYLDRAKDAIRTYKKAIKLDSTNACSWNSLGHIYRMLDRIPEATIAYKEAIALDPEDGTFHSSLAACYRKSSCKNETSEQIRLARPFMKKENEYNRACFESICGNEDKAVELLKIALKKKQISLDQARRDPSFDFIREVPRFKALVGER